MDSVFTISTLYQCFTKTSFVVKQSSAVRGAMVGIITAWEWTGSALWYRTGMPLSDGGSVGFHNRSSVRIGWCIRCDFADYNRFTHIHWIKHFWCPERKFRSILFFFPLSVCKGNNWFSFITLGKIYCQSSGRLSVSETSLPCGLFVHINLVIACFVQASDDWLLKMRIDLHNQQLLRLINRLFPIISTSLLSVLSNYNSLKGFDRRKPFWLKK